MIKVYLNKNLVTSYVHSNLFALLVATILTFNSCANQWTVSIEVTFKLLICIGLLAFGEKLLTCIAYNCTKRPAGSNIWSAYLAFMRNYFWIHWFWFFDIFRIYSNISWMNLNRIVKVLNIYLRKLYSFRLNYEKFEP